MHDNGIGIGFWAPAIDSEIYGCVIYRNGRQGPAPDRGHGHGIYGQNAEGMKRIVNNIVFDQYGYGIHNYTQAGELKGFHIEGNIVFNNGSASTPKDAGFPNILVGGFRAAERITITNNYTYTFTDWSRHTGYDRNSHLIRTATGRPTGLKIAALPNQYEAGRANIVVYNWDLKERVEVDVSGALRNGDRFEVRNARDFYGQPVLSGVYDGRLLSLPMAGSQPAPEFGAFVLMKRIDREN